MKNFKDLYEEVKLNESKDKTFLVKVGRSNINDEFINAWKETANSDIQIISVEKYSNDVLKVVLSKGSAAKLKSMWMVKSVQSYQH